MGCDDFIQSCPSGGSPGFPELSPDLTLRVTRLENYYKFSYVPESYAAWIVASAVVASFAPVINGAKDQPHLATFLVIIGLAIIIWATPLYFITRWQVYNRWMLFGLLAIILALVAAEIWIIVRIWVPFVPSNQNIEEKSTR